MAYYRKRFEKCKNNLMDTWVAINEVIGRNNRTNLPEILKINGKLVKDNQIIADKLNAFSLKLAISWHPKLIEILMSVMHNFFSLILAYSTKISMRYRQSFSTSLTSCPQKQARDTRPPFQISSYNYINITFAC